MNAYDELGGGRSLPASYDTCKHRPCPDCGADPDEACTFDVQVPSPSGPTTVRRPRHAPCVARTRSRKEHQ